VIARTLWFLLLAAATAPSARAQFELYVVNGTVEVPAPALYDYGSVYPGESPVVHFRLRNVTAAPAAVTVLVAAGAGFTVNAPPLPVGLDSQAALDFTVLFQSATPGTYSAVLYSQGVSALLTATVLPRLTYDGIGAGPVDFGSVMPGASVTRHFTIENLTTLVLTVPAIAVLGDVFSLLGQPPSGQVLQPGQTSAFDIRFQPQAAGTASGSVVIGDRTYALTGAAVEPPLPKPAISLDRSQYQSAQQVVVAVKLDSASKTAGSGTLTIDLRPLPQNASDSSIQFAGGGRSVPFTVSAGDTQVHFGDQLAATFQTGTTAGDIVVAATLGGASDQQIISVTPAPIALTSVKGLRSSASIELDLTGFDNTRTAGSVTYTFFDAAGNAISPGAITIDNTADFARYFQGSDLGGAFELRATFPVTGDASRIAAFEVQIANSYAATKSPRTNF
jgi:hypothetical protein